MSDQQVPPPERITLEKRLVEIEDELRVRARAGLEAQNYIAEALNAMSTRDLEEEAYDIRNLLDGKDLSTTAVRPTTRPLALLRLLRGVGMALAVIGVAYGIYALATGTPLWGAVGVSVSGVVIAYAALDALRRNTTN